MALKTDDLKQSIKTAYLEAQTMKTQGEAIEFLSTKLSEAMEAFVKSGDVKVIALSGQISVQGTATAQANISPIAIDGKPTLGGGIT